MFGTMASTVLTSAEAKGVLARGGVLAQEGALEGERVRELEGRQDEVLSSRLQGGDPTPSCCLLDMLPFRLW
jgi:hypothetical protein